MFTLKEQYSNIRLELGVLKIKATRIPDRELAKKIRGIYNDVDDKVRSLPDEKPKPDFKILLAQECFKDDPETLAQVEQIKDKISSLRFFFDGDDFYLIFNPDIQREELETLEEIARKVESAATG